MCFYGRNCYGNENIAEDIDIIVIADVKTQIPENEIEKLNQYIAKGGNLILLGDLGRQNEMNLLVELFDVQFTPGTLVQCREDYVPNLIVSNVTREAPVDVRRPPLLDNKLTITTTGLSSTKYLFLGLIPLLLLVCGLVIWLRRRSK